ncbi:MAG TPA: MFS transporter [Verrucomicrobiae bacterium]|nr:MFS transporter [Verrucomicrobiae bacterium]
MTEGKFQWKAFSVLSTGHLVNDMYANFMPQLIPFLILSQGFSVAKGTTLAAAFTISSSFLQPFFGYLVDMKGQRWLVHITGAWTALLLGLTGFINNYFLMLVVAALAGLGSAAFHPQASAMVGEIGGKRKGFILSGFIATGNFGLAVSPLFLLPLFDTYGIKATWVAMIPGVLASLMVYKFAPRQHAKQGNAPGLAEVLQSLKKASGELSKLVMVVSIRSLVHSGLMTLLPLYLLSHQYSAQNTSYLMFSTLAIGAVGGVIGGWLSDRYGRKPLIVGSLALASVFFWGFLNTGGIFKFIMLGLGGMALLSSFSVTVAVAQDVIPQNRAIASGLSLGFAIGMGGLAVSPLGKYADIYGVDAAVHLVFMLPVAAAILALLLKGDPVPQAAPSKA